jgi:hypothetical protein
MKTSTVIVLIVVTVVLTSAVWYLATTNQNVPIHNATPTPSTAVTTTTNPTNVSYLPTTVTSDLTSTHIRSNGDYLLINGTVTNSSPNTAYNVGLNVYATSFIDGFNRGVAINMVVPIVSHEYVQLSPTTAAQSFTQEGDAIIVSNVFPLTTLAPHESVPIIIKIYPIGQSEDSEFLGSGATVTLVWANMP